MAKRANVVFRFAIQGDGRNEIITRQPLASNPDVTVTTGGAVSLNSPASMGSIVLPVGWAQLVDPASYLTTPMARTYYALIPPQGSTCAIAIAGSTTDVGIGLVPGQPLVLAMPAGPVSLYAYNSGSTGLLCGQWIW